ncbi:MULTISPECIES: ADP-ribosyltransferase [Dehalobacter]|uniref:ADP ribosyltransferase domain-containing protein n=2 Tax=Dehalobacter restrictus TaxID=55583 RepID=A0A857DFB8_9FIRM|nr:MULTISPECIES: ADP-ribosyltransferase [Dehalobacter]AHF11214.1 hypothetical protein DEHRE_01645 [Dehalobacter restrictus DSM 9455]MCG1025502.1 hypothetical protein [Dehalobacter sp.]MDJ0306104.1 hypothetical protein [Dehalobacter sp.]OCZ51937.1 hypothetical protein A7D23_12260 [Dehalobacter sp. TeCB1]QGZ99502.1 hypothetical protein GQ588_01925 [Dehalobacter restrictus]
MIGKEMYKEFHSSQDAEDWAKKYFHEWINNLQLKADKNLSQLLFEYSGNMNIVYNRYLRGNQDFSDKEAKEYSEDIKTISNALCKFELKENIIVYRYTHKNLLKLLFNSSKPKVGKTFVEKGFLSTTLVRDLLKDFAKEHHYNCVLKIFLPIGTKGAFIKFNDSLLNEQEFLLPPNTKFMLIRKSINRRLQMVYECKLVDQQQY